MRIAQALRSRRTAALVDQGLVSGTNFLVFLYCARQLSQDQWGEFSFAYAAAIFAQGFQRAIVTIPMASFSTYGDQGRCHAQGWAGLNSALIGLAALLQVVASGVLWVTGFTWLSKSLLLAALLGVPLLLQEFCRRTLIQNERFGALVAMAAAYASAGFLAAALWRQGWGLGWMPAAVVLAAALSATVVGATGRWRELLGNPTSIVLPEGHRGFSFWAVLSHLGYSGYNFGVQSVMAASVSAHAVGAFYACRTLVQPVNTLVAAIDSVDKPQAARAYAQGGRKALLVTIRRSAVPLAVLGGVYVGLMLTFGSDVLRLAYGDKYLGNDSVVALWCLVAMITAFTQPVESGLYVIKQTRALFKSRICASLAGLGMALWLVSSYGVCGALVSVACGFAVAAMLGALALFQRA